MPKGNYSRLCGGSRVSYFLSVFNSGTNIYINSIKLVEFKNIFLFSLFFIFKKGLENECLCFWNKVIGKRYIMRTILPCLILYYKHLQHF